MVRLVDDDVGEVIWSEPIVSAEKGLNGSDDDTELLTSEVLSAFECSVSTDGLLDLVLGLLKEFFAVRDDEGATLGAIGYVSEDDGLPATSGDDDQRSLIIFPRLEDLTHTLFLVRSQLHSVSLRFVVLDSCHPPEAANSGGLLFSG